MIRPLKTRDLKNFIYYCQNTDYYKDFYVTKNNKRLFLNDINVAKEVFNDCMKWGNKCYIKEERNEIKALILVVGYKDKKERKYVKILCTNKKDFKDLFNYLNGENLKNLFVKVNMKNRNFLQINKYKNTFRPVYILRRIGFKIITVRKDKNEVLMKKEDRNYGSYKHRR